MSFIRITEPNVAAVPLDDLGITVAQAAVTILTNQFTIQDLYVSADLEAAIIAGDLTVEIDYGTGFTAISAGDYTNRDALGAFLNIYELTNENNNEDLVDGSEVNASGPLSAPLHIHDARYYTETEISGIGGAALVGVDNSGWTVLTGSTVQAVFNAIDTLFGTFDLDNVYDNDVDGILNVDGSGKDLDFKSDNTNNVIISRTDTTTHQNILETNVAGNQLLLGGLVSGLLAQTDVRVISDLIVDGDITFTGTITDTTVNELNVTNSKILLRDGAATGADASIEVERGSTGADACILWNETIDRWQMGIVGDKNTVAFIDEDEDVSGNWCFGGAATDPNLCLTEKASAPTTNLGAAGEIPMAMLPNGLLAIYDKSNSRNKFLSVQRQFMIFHGRNNANNTNEHARIGEIPSNNSGNRVIRNATIVGMSIQTKGNETWTAEIRKNGVVTVITSLAAAAASGNETGALNVDVNAGDEIQAFINGSQVDRPIIKVELAYRF
jgi:hypothetical protein